MDLSQLLQQYGYVAVFLGTFAEGETMLLLGGYAAHRGYLDLLLVIATAYTAAVAGDQTYFHLGRRYGTRLLSRQPKLGPKVELALRLIGRYGSLIVLVMRFMWGLRIALPVALGMSGMSARRYLAFDLLAAALWSTIIASIGFGATGLLAEWIGNLHHRERWIIGILVLLALAVLVWRWYPRRAKPGPRN